MFKKKTDDLKAAKNAVKDDVPSSKYIPFGVHVSPSVVKLLENGDLCATWRLHGISFDTLSVSELASAKNQLVNFLHAVRGTDQAEPCALWVHRIRRVVSDSLKGTFPTQFAQKLSDKYYRSLGEQTFLQNELYFTLIIRPSVGASKEFKRSRVKNAESLAAFDSEVLNRFDVLCNQVSASLVKYGGERLVAFERSTKNGETLYASPMLSFYRYLLTGMFEEVIIEHSSINEYLSNCRVFAGDSNGIVQLNHPDKTTFVGYLDLLDYPAVSKPGMNNVLFLGDYEYIETQSFSFLGKRAGIEALELQQKRLISSGQGSTQQIDDLNLAIEDLRNSRVFMGEYHYTLGVFGEDVASTQINMSAARSALQEEAGYNVATVDRVPECAYFAQLPGNWFWRPRQASVTSRNFASFAPMHNFDSGKRDGNPWGQAITIFDTPTRQPYYFNFHQVIFGRDRQGEKDPGNTFMCGMTGTGKSVTLGFMLSMLTKVPKLRILFFDKDRGSEILIRALGGRYRQLKRGQPTGFNPFQWDPTAGTRKFVERLVYQCALRAGEPSLDVKLENELINAVQLVFDLPERKYRRISAILQFVGENSEIGQRLSKWCRTESKTGANAWVLDNAQDTTDFSHYSIFGYDYTEFLGDSECGPIILNYILEAADTLINGDPFVYVMEEFAKAVASDAQGIVEFARDKQTTIRKLNGLGIFVTQSPSQVIQYPIGNTLREQCVTQIFLPNPKAERADYVDGFKLSDTEFDLLKSFATDSRTFLIKEGERTAVCRLNLYGFQDELAVLTATPESLEILDRVRAELRTDDPDIWMQPFLTQLEASKAVSQSLRDASRQ
jgi:type IV secretion system protein VirB4